MPADWGSFFAMGGYAVYVWPVYGLGAIILIGNIITPHVRERRLRRRGRPQR